MQSLASGDRRIARRRHTSCIVVTLPLLLLLVCLARGQSDPDTVLPSYELREEVIEDTSDESQPQVDVSTVALDSNNVEVEDETNAGSTELPREKYTREVPQTDDNVVFDRPESERRDVGPDELTSYDDNTIKNVGETIPENVERHQKDTIDISERKDSIPIDEPMKQGSIADFFHKFSPPDEFADDRAISNHEEPIASQNQTEAIDTTADGSSGSNHDEGSNDSLEEVDPESQGSNRSNDGPLVEDDLSPDKQSETDEIGGMTLNLVDFDEAEQDSEDGNSGKESVNVPLDVPLGSNSSVDDHSLSNVTKPSNETSEPQDPFSDITSSNQSTSPDPEDSMGGRSIAKEQLPVDEYDGMAAVKSDPNNSSLPIAIPLNGESDSDDTLLNKTTSSTEANNTKQPSNATLPGNQRTQSAVPAPKGSLAEFVRKAKNNVGQGGKDGPIQSSQSTRAASTSELESSAAHTTESASIPPGQKTEAKVDEHIYKIPVWGTTKHYRTQPSLPVLHELFQDSASWERYFSENPPIPRNNTMPPISKNSTARQQSDVSEANRTESVGNQTTENQPSFPTTQNDFVNGLDDIDKLFEDIDPPDDLDVAGDGTSIREVLMGSATRVLLKRVRRTAGFVRDRTVLAAQWATQRCRTWWDDSEPPLSWMQNKHGDWAPFRALRNPDGQWAPLRYIRTVDGEFAPLQRIRNKDGEIPWESFMRKTFRWLKTTAIDIYERGETLLDRWFEGPEVDDADFDFFNDPPLA